ncbi:hypothetical protein J3B02_002436 [Coemansia erecta]|uniref:UspA domain-containing protein n=1 Tax=Coemansia asiatica TaxID=1052880 RepID=A0A9W7XK50_9FUNG|nr:hypothetical protein LPJ64_003933 [Coemansia asiatica]KAJ2854920.1 hypothetical protein J3B02_002436 [Coemansia erecta]KAJ2879540.1 hypothetical protein FB639_003063 [Coemansia asiatica]
MSSSQQYIPLSLRRKIVIALDCDLLIPPPITDDTPESASGSASNRFLTFKTVAWAKANIIRPTEDHVFLVTAIDPTASAVDANVISAMWTSLFSDQDPHVDKPKVAEQSLKRLSEALSRVGVSVSVDVVAGEPGTKIPEYVHLHRGEILVVQAPERSAFASSMWYSWADLCAQRAECPTVMVKKSDLPDNVAVALDPPLPTATTTAEVEESSEENY